MKGSKKWNESGDEKKIFHCFKIQTKDDRRIEASFPRMRTPRLSLLVNLRINSTFLRLRPICQSFRRSLLFCRCLHLDDTTESLGWHQKHRREQQRGLLR